MSTNNELLVRWKFSELILLITFTSGVPLARRQMSGSGNRTTCYFVHRLKWQKNSSILRELYCTSQDTSFKAISVVLVGTWCADVQTSLASDQQLSSSSVSWNVNSWCFSTEAVTSTQAQPLADCELCGVNSTWLQSAIHAGSSDAPFSSHVTWLPKMLHPPIRIHF